MPIPPSDDVETEHGTYLVRHGNQMHTRLALVALAVDRQTRPVTHSLTIAALQYAVTPSVARNAQAIARGLFAAAARGARLALTPECGLPGYAGWDFPTLGNFDWTALRDQTARLQADCARARCWLALGSMHYLDDDTPPLNCLYLIDDRGTIVNRYDKVCLTAADQRFFSAGARPCLHTIDDVTVGFRICHDICYPDSYTELKAAGAAVVAHAFHNAGFDGPNILDETGPAWLRVRAADTQLWIAAVNNSKRHSSWPSCFARPDGRLVDQATRHRAQQILRPVPAPIDELGSTSWLHGEAQRTWPPVTLAPIGHVATHPRARSPIAAP